MSEVTSILSKIEQGDPQAAEKLLPLVYDELRKLATSKLEQEPPGQTLQATALVHDAYLRLIGPASSTQQPWSSRGHFFAAAARAMRRILVDQARRKNSAKHGGDYVRHELSAVDLTTPELREDLIVLNEALDRLEKHDPQAAQLVHLRYFAGLTVPESAESLGLSVRSTERLWTYARAWLHDTLATED